MGFRVLVLVLGVRVKGLGFRVKVRVEGVGLEPWRSRPQTHFI